MRHQRAFADLFAPGGERNRHDPCERDRSDQGTLILGGCRFFRSVSVSRRLVTPAFQRQFFTSFANISRPRIGTSLSLWHHLFLSRTASCEKGVRFALPRPSPGLRAVKYPRRIQRTKDADLEHWSQPIIFLGGKTCVPRAPTGTHFAFTCLSAVSAVPSGVAKLRRQLYPMNHRTPHAWTHALPKARQKSMSACLENA